MIFRSRVGSLVSKKIPSPRFSPGSCPKAPASPPVLFVNEYQKPPVLPRFSSQMPPVLPRFFWVPPVLPRFFPHSTPTVKISSPQVALSTLETSLRFKGRMSKPWREHYFITKLTLPEYSPLVLVFPKCRWGSDNELPNYSLGIYLGNCPVPNCRNNSLQCLWWQGHYTTGKKKPKGQMVPFSCMCSPHGPYLT